MKRLRDAWRVLTGKAWAVEKAQRGHVEFRDGQLIFSGGVTADNAYHLGDHSSLTPWPGERCAPDAEPGQGHPF